MVDTKIGIELDGTRATVVEVTGHSAVSSRLVVGSTPQEALQKAVEGIKPGKKAPHIRVAFVSSNSAVRRVDLTAKALVNRTAFEDAAYANMPEAREGTAAAGLFFNRETLVGDTLGSGLAAVAPVEAVEDVYRALAKFDNLEVVPPAFALVGFNGLHLAFRYSNADLTLVRDGMPVLHRQLRTGGLNNVAGYLGDGGEQRLEAVMNRSGAPDMMAEDELNRHLRALAAEVSATRNHWLGSGETIPEGIYLYGDGARVRDFVEYLNDEGLEVQTHEELLRSLTYIPLGAREGATGAFLAGVSYGHGAPASSYPSAVVRDKVLAGKKKSRNSKRALLVAAALAVPLAAYFGPIATGQADIRAAEEELFQAQTRFDSVIEENDQLRKVQTLESTYEKIASNDPRWNAILTQAFDTANTSGATIGDINARYTDDVLLVSLTASAYDPAGSYLPLTGWLTLLEDPEGTVRATNVSTTGFSYDAETETSSFQVTFRIPVDLVLEERDLSGETK